MAEHHRYAEDPDRRRYSGDSPYGPDGYQRPDSPYQVPEQRGDEARRAFTDGADATAATPSYGGSAAEPFPPAVAYRPDDPLGPTVGLSRAGSRDVAEDPAPPRSALDAIRVPLRPTEYPAVRPGGAAPSADPEPPTASWGTPRTMSPVEPTSAGPTGGVPAPGGAYHELTSFVPPVGKRAAPDAAGPDRSAPERGGAARRAAGPVYRSRRFLQAVGFAAVVALLMVPAVRLLVQAAFLDVPAARGIVPAVLLVIGLPLTGFGLFSLAGSGPAADRGTWLRLPVGYLPVGLVLLVGAALAVS